MKNVVKTLSFGSFLITFSRLAVKFVAMRGLVNDP